MSRINHNITAMITNGTLSNSNSNLAKSLERLSTGIRINRSSDDVTGLTLSEKIRTQVRGNAMASRNANDGSAMLTIAESACGEVSDILQRMRELAIQSASDTLATTERSYTNQEFQSLMTEINRIAGSTQYNGITLLDGKAGSFGVAGGNDSVIHVGSDFGIGNLRGTSQLLVVGILPLTLGALGLTQGLSSIASHDGAYAAIDAVDAAIKRVSTVRSDLGASINRLDEVIKNLEVQASNVTSAESTIRDVDFAQEMTEFTRNQILTQSATSMLAQANQSPQRVLELLK